MSNVLQFYPLPEDIKTNYPHKHILSLSHRHLYSNLKTFVKQKHGITIECSHCDKLQPNLDLYDKEFNPLVSHKNAEIKKKTKKERRREFRERNAKTIAVRKIREEIASTCISEEHTAIDLDDTQVSKANNLQTQSQIKINITNKSLATKNKEVQKQKNKITKANKKQAKKQSRNTNIEKVQDNIAEEENDVIFVGIIGTEQDSINTNLETTKSQKDKSSNIEIQPLDALASENLDNRDKTNTNITNMNQRWPSQSQHSAQNQFSRDNEFARDINDAELKNTFSNPEERKQYNAKPKPVKPSPRVGRVLPRVMTKASGSDASKVTETKAAPKAATPGSVIPCVVSAVRNPKKLKLSETTHANLNDNYSSNVTPLRGPPPREVIVHPERTVIVDKDDVIFMHQPGPSGVLKTFGSKTKKGPQSNNLPVNFGNYDQHIETPFSFRDHCPPKRTGVPVFDLVGQQMPGETVYTYSSMLTAQQHGSDSPNPSNITRQVENSLAHQTGVPQFSDIDQQMPGETDYTYSTMLTAQHSSDSRNLSNITRQVENNLAHHTVPERVEFQSDPTELFLKTTQVLEPDNSNIIKTEERTSTKSTESELKKLRKEDNVTETILPISERPEIVFSTDRTVLKLMKHWPWNKSPIRELARISYKSSKKEKQDVYRFLERTSQESAYWIKVTVTGYPRSWDRQKMLDALVTWQHISKLPFTPCFVEFTPLRTKFLVNKCSATLKVLFSKGLVIVGDDYRLNITVIEVNLSQKDLRFRLATFLEYRLISLYDNVAKSVDFTAFLLKPDISLMCHFPLCKIYNQRIVLEVPSQIKWGEVTKLILASNKLTSLEGFDLQKNLPSLQELDISDNMFTSVSQLVSCQGCSATTVRLEGNPLCLNFIQQDEYTDAVKLIFPKIVYLDGVKIRGLPVFRRHFCQNREALPLVEQFLEMYYALLECDDRFLLYRMYSAGAMLTLSCQARLKKLPEYVDVAIVRSCRDIRILNEVMEESFVGNENIADMFASWPAILHDAATFTVDVLSYTESSLILTVTGSLRVLSETIPDNCPLLDFMRTCMLSSRDGTEYVIRNDMWYLAEPTTESRAKAFAQPLHKPSLSLQLTSAPDENLKNDLIEIVMRVTSLTRSESLKCLEMRNWDIKSALQYFMELLQDNEVSTLSSAANI